MPWSPAAFIATAVSTACNKEPESMPAIKKHYLSRPSGLSVDVRTPMAGKGRPTLVKKEDSSRRVPLSETAAKMLICRQL